MVSINEKIIHRAFDQHSDDIVVSHRVTGSVYETLDLDKAQLQRELLPTGEIGDVQITVAESYGYLGRYTEQKPYRLNNGQLKRGYGNNPEGKTISRLRRASLLAKVAFGKPLNDAFETEE